MNAKIGILFVNFGPYHIARLKELVNSSEKLEQEIVALEIARFQEEYPWQVELEECGFSLISIIKDKSLEKTNIFELLIRINQVLNQVNPDVLAIAGYSEISMLFALIWCLANDKKAILFSETTEQDAKRYWWREFCKKLIVKQYTSVLVGGKPHERYMIRLGMPKDAVFLGYDVVDNDNFCAAKIRSLPRPIEIPYFLAINRFIPKKNLPFLISAYAEYFEKNLTSLWDLVICGDGELWNQIKEQINNLGLRDHIHLPGFLQQQELLPYFAHAGCFIHASVQEQWGLVVNEAMAAGLPVLVSNRCGCFEDLVIGGVNGFGFDPENIQELTELMIKISSGEIDLDKMGQASFEHIQKYSPEYFARGLQKAIAYAITQQ
jgi:glycosyltransferase involved in cell wall biosynthesis